MKKEDMSCENVKIDDFKLEPPITHERKEELRRIIDRYIGMVNLVTDVIGDEYKANISSNLDLTQDTVNMEIAFMNEVFYEDMKFISPFRPENK